MTVSDTIIHARREIEDILGAMVAGKPIECSDDLMVLCDQVVRQLDTAGEEIDVGNWAKEMANDLIKFTD